MDKYNGIYKGIVADNSDPNNMLRIRAQVPQVLGQTLTGWALPCQSRLTAPPPRQTPVWIMFEGGDVNWPVWMGQWFTPAQGQTQKTFSANTVGWVWGMSRIDLYKTVASTDTGWIPVLGGVGFQNSWGNRGVGGDPVAAYRKIGNEVRIRGMISGGTINTTAFTLPAGFHPLFNVFRPCASNHLYGEGWVDTSGNVNPRVGSNTWFDLYGLGNFMVDS